MDTASVSVIDSDSDFVGVLDTASVAVIDSVRVTPLPLDTWTDSVIDSDRDLDGDLDRLSDVVMVSVSDLDGVSDVFPSLIDNDSVNVRVNIAPVDAEAVIDTDSTGAMRELATLISVIAIDHECDVPWAQVSLKVPLLAVAL